MSDIRTCSECNEQFHMDNGHQCNICYCAEYCGACDLDNGFTFECEDGTYYICKDCIEQYREKDIDWLIKEVGFEIDKEDFEKELKEYENWMNRRVKL